MDAEGETLLLFHFLVGQPELKTEGCAPALLLPSEAWLRSLLHCKVEKARKDADSAARVPHWTHSASMTRWRDWL